MTGSTTKSLLFGYRKWNILAFRGRLMSLLAPARGMPTLSAKDGFSRPSSYALRGLIEAFAPTGQGRLRQRYIARRKSGFLFQGVSHIPFASIAISSTVCFTFDSSWSIPYNPNCKIYYLSLFEALHR